MQSRIQIVFNVLVALLICYWVALFISTHTQTTLPDLIDNFDKIVHFSAYGLLAFALTITIFFRWGLLPRIGIWVWTTTVVYGSIDEYTQRFVPGREPELLDLTADVCGSAVGIGCAYGLAYLCLRWQKQAPHEASPI